MQSSQTQSWLDSPCEVHSRQGGRQRQHKVIRARCCPGRRGSDGGRLPGGGDGKLEFEKSYSFYKYLSHTYPRHSAIFTRLMEEASLDKRNSTCRSLECERPLYTLRV